MTSAETNAARQRAHWDTVLGADNIGETPVTRAQLEREITFTRTPECRPLWCAVASRTEPLVVDLGGGLGTWAVALARAGCRVVVADVSGARLRVLRGLLAELGLASRVMLVQTSAEQMALRAAVADVLWTRSVLIHTDLDTAMAEIARVLGPDGDAVLCEPMTRNPFINLHRRLFAPRAWGSLATYFDPARVELALAALRGTRQEHFHGVAALAFFWQFGVRSVALFWITLMPLWVLDRGLMHVCPAWRRRAWFVVMTGWGR